MDMRKDSLPSNSSSSSFLAIANSVFQLKANPLLWLQNNELGEVAGKPHEAHLEVVCAVLLVLDVDLVSVTRFTKKHSLLRVQGALPTVPVRLRYHLQVCNPSPIQVKLIESRRGLNISFLAFLHQT